jgi:UDP-N-acetyl-D-mannosaminuronate dehydrogenase
MNVNDCSNRSAKDPATLVVGLGEVGSAVAGILDRTDRVLRHDLERVEIIDSIGVLHLCIPFQSPIQFQEAALSYVERFSPVLTIIHSTVLPGTTRLIAEKSGAPIAYSPVRGKHVRMEEDLLRYTKFVAAPSAVDAQHAEEHLARAGMNTKRIAKVETLELAKLAETTYFGVCIAFAQELNRYADRVRADYTEAIAFFDEVNCLPREHYYPGFIGGHCVMPNIHLLLQIAPSPFLEAIVDSNERLDNELKSRPTAFSETAAAQRQAAEAKVLVDR